MGVKKLLKSLKSILREVNLRKLKVAKVGIDGHMWIHTSLENCEEELLLQNNVGKIVNAMKKKLRLILDSGKTDQAWTWWSFSTGRVWPSNAKSPT